MRSCRCLLRWWLLVLLSFRMQADGEKKSILLPYNSQQAQAHGVIAALEGTKNVKVYASSLASDKFLDSFISQDKGVHCWTRNQKFSWYSLHFRPTSGLLSTLEEGGKSPQRITLSVTGREGTIAALGEYPFASQLTRAKGMDPAGVQQPRGHRGFFQWTLTSERTRGRTLTRTLEATTSGSP